MKLNTIRRILVEDFPKDNAELMSKLAQVLNPFIEQLVQGMNQKQLTINDNLNQFIRNVDVRVNSDGVPTSQTAYKNELSNRISGAIVIRAQNLDNIGTHPEGSPFISFQEENKIITIRHVTGLQENQRYRLTVLNIGN